MRDDELTSKLTSDELASWEAIVIVAKTFLGNQRANNYSERVEKLLTAYELIGVRMSLKMYFLHSHLDCFSPNLDDVSDEHGEGFHQDMKVMESRYLRS